ncbi:thiamine pyrophosphate-dependent dehydrogenase E1 component subunit alpha [Salmonella enterica]|nr:thiamine pyrophosphate-dependent dehydrogenase E1 component subunit alpha [Salmonella enterica subsp. enterica]EGT9726050.1 thiamine pyrophosphate-dependent dehydrogenase E1 component subunit alpha [Salmonella enterica]EHW1157883.1 thiamine pyrophosphate-dependent dehydrogenase E1 component subunit alpha [Salmonella enterica subsp. enterica serovar Takoradi]EHF9647275.1 thiamine pyrophosphate-dependent dehydrogenase E1 component subunit alpha [Salmonella enterica]EJJ5776042.1 thiamine pyroph
MTVNQDKNNLIHVYRKMKLIREFEERLHEENVTGNIPGFLHLYAGEEAIAVGVCDALKNTDYIGSTHRGHGHCIARGCDVNGMMAEIFGKASGLCHGKGGSMHIADLSKGMLGANGIVGSAPSLVLGAALSAKYTKKDSVAVSFTGDGGSNQGLVFEAMNMAVVLKLPVIFVFENNGYGEATGHDYSVGSQNITTRSAGFGMPAVCVDGTDYFAVNDAMKDAVTRARDGQGPSVIEAKAIRWYGHFEGDPGLYRSKEEVTYLRQEHDPLKIFTQKTAHLISREELNAIDTEIKEIINDAVIKAHTAAYPSPDELLSDVCVSY